MRAPSVLLWILTLAAASPSPMGSLQRRAGKVVQFSIDQQFVMQPSNSPITNLQGVETYFQGDGNFVVSVPVSPPPPIPPLYIRSRPSHHPVATPSSHFHSHLPSEKLTPDRYEGNAIWSSNTAYYNCEGGDTCRLAWQGDGNLVIYVNGAAKWSSNTAGRGKELVFSSQSYAMKITGVESNGGAPTLWHASDTGNEPDPGAPGPGACGGVDCFSCTDCIISAE